MSRPWTVRLAVATGLLVALSGLGSTVFWLVLAGRRPGAPVLGLTHHTGVLFLLGRLPAAVVWALLAVGVWRGARVARGLQTALSGLLLVSVLVTWIGPQEYVSRAGATGAVTLVGGAAVLVLLWLPASRRWFRRDLS